MIKVTSATSSVSSFTWSTSEQVYPFEKDNSGHTLYCKQVDFGALPASQFAQKNVAHGISGFTTNNLYKVFGTGKYPVGDYAIPLPSVELYGNFQGAYMFVTNTNISIKVSGDLSFVSGIVYIIYNK